MRCEVRQTAEKQYKRNKPQQETADCNKGWGDGSPKDLILAALALITFLTAT